MFRVVISSSRRGYSTTVRRMAEAAPTTAAANVVFNLNTPHAPIMVNKTIQSVVLPGETGEYGITAGHSPLISQLKPGVVAITHAGVFFFTSSKFGIDRSLFYVVVIRARPRNTSFPEASLSQTPPPP